MLQVPRAERDAVIATLRQHGLGRHSHAIGKTNDKRLVEVWRDAKSVFSAPLRDLQQAWDEVSWRIARLRDHPECADSEHAAAGADSDTGLHQHLSFDPAEAPALLKTRPKVAILREQGVNSHVEMSYAMAQAGFDSFDLHMSDLQSGRARLDMFQAFVACGGFSYGDTLGRRRGLGALDPVQPGAGRTVRRLLQPCRHAGAGRVQRLPDDGRAEPDHPRRVGLAEVHAQPQRAVRGPAVTGGGAGTAQACSSAAWPAAGCRSPWRMARALPTSRSAAMPPRCSARCVSSILRASRPRPIRPTRTAAPRA